MDYLKKLFFNNFIPAIISTFGVFCLTFLLMYIHYRIRKKEYKKMLSVIKSISKEMPYVDDIDFFYLEKYSFRNYLRDFLNDKYKDLYMRWRVEVWRNKDLEFKEKN